MWTCEIIGRLLIDFTVWIEKYVAYRKNPVRSIFPGEPVSVTVGYTMISIASNTASRVRFVQYPLHTVHVH